MRDRVTICCGVAVFLAFATFPAWHNLAARVTAGGPKPVLPKTEKQCVAPLAYMKTSHMNLLIDWRDNLVRRGERSIAAGGTRYNVSLTSTCLTQCHGSKKEFCDRCHDYAAVSLPCWDCHEDTPASRPATVAQGFGGLP